MFTIPNILSFIRIPLALVFLQENPFYRALAIALALLSDGLDGYLARRTNNVSRFGTLLDPFSDKFFVLFICFFFINEHKLSLLDASLLVCRDFSVLLFGVFLLWKGRLKNYQFRSIWCGKITTVCQLIVLFGLTCNVPIPSYFYTVFLVLGLLAFVELIIRPMPEASK